MIVLHQKRWGRRVVATLAVALLLTATGDAGQGEAPADVRASLEGTWELEEWHHDGRVLRPPQVGGRWSNHDGIVMANFHRVSGRSFESFAGYGTYEMDATTWSYAYERAQTASGPSPDEARVSVRTGLEMGTFKMTREGGKIILEAPNDRREYDGGAFLYMPNGQLLRKYRKVQ